LNTINRRKIRMDKTYENQGFRIKYPKDWELKEKGEGYKVHISKKREGLDSTLLVIIRDISELNLKNPLEDYTKMSIENLKNMSQDFSNLKITDKEFQYQPGKHINYTETDKATNLPTKILTVLTILGKLAIVMLFGCLVEHYKEDGKLAEEMIDTFELI